LKKLTNLKIIIKLNLNNLTIMQKTQTYLTSILEKRMGLIPNYTPFAKTITSPLQTPHKQPKLSSMPNIFRNRIENIHQTKGPVPDLNETKNGTLDNTYWQSRLEGQKAKMALNGKVEYAVISNRIEKRK
jgi:hypothetical protein